MSRNSAFDLVAQFMGRQNIIPVPVPFVMLLGDYTSAAFLSQCIYWGDRTEAADGWFHKTHDEWQSELMLTPDQVRRCVKTCGDMIEVKRAGIPARNYYRANREAVAMALQNLSNESQMSTTRSGETQQLAVDKPNDSTRANPTTSRPAKATSHKGTKTTSEPTPNKHIQNLAADAAVLVPDSELERINQPLASLSDQASTDPQASANESRAEGTDQVPPVAPTVSTSARRLMAVYNEHRKHLPAAEAMTPGREKALKRLLGQFGGPDPAVAALADATQEVAADEFWQGKGWGLDNLLPKIAQKAEAWRARATLPKTTDPTTSTTLAFNVGQRVSYKRDKYTVEAVSDTYIDLYDEVNGSSRITFASSDFTAIKAVGVNA